MPTDVDSSTPDLLSRTMARVLPRYFLLNRLGVRLVEALTLVALGTSGHGPVVAAVAAFALYDIGMAWLLRRRRLPLWLRLGLDSLDVGVWSLLIGHTLDVAAMAALPLCVEAGMRFGLRPAVLVVPVTIGVVASTFCLAAGQRPGSGPFLWPLVGTVYGMLVIAYAGENLRRKLSLADRQSEAAAGQAELAGQSSVALGADTIVDLLARTASLVGLDGAQTAAIPLTAWRAALADSCTTRATYLGVAVARWQRLRNSMNHDLKADVDLRCTGASGTVLLSPDQVRHLERSLDRLRLRGRVPVEVRSLAAAGRPQVVLVGERRVVLPADMVPEGPILDLGPVTFALSGVLILGQSLPSSDGVPLWVTVPIAVASIALAWWAHRRLGREGSAARAGVLAVAIALGAADALLSSATLRNGMVGGLPRLPSLLFLAWVGPLIVIYLDDLSPAQRVMAVGAAVAIALAGIGMRVGAVMPVQLLTAPLWPGMAVLISLGMRDALELDTAEIRQYVQGRHLEAVETAYRRGRRLVFDLAAAAARDTREICARMGATLDPTLAAELERRLTDADERLRALRLVI